MRTAALLFSVFAAATSSGVDYEDLPSLYDAISTGSNQRVGFLSQGNYETVKDMLPATTAPIIFSHTADLENAVTNGSLVGGLISGALCGYNASQAAPPLPLPLPRSHRGANIDAPTTHSPPRSALCSLHHPAAGTPGSEFHHFSSTLVSPRAMLTPDKPASDASYRPLLEALDAAIVRVIGAGKVTDISRNHTKSGKPFAFVAVHTCKPTDTFTEFPYPTAGGSDKLSTAITRGFIRVGALGPYNWGVDGDYTKTVPVGFYPSYFDAISRELVKHYNPTGSNSFVGLKRVYKSSSQGVLDDLSNDVTDTTEPYWTIDSMYNSRARKSSFKQSCTTVGMDSTFFTRKSTPATASVGSGSDGVSFVVVGVLGAVVATLAVAAIALAIVTGVALFARKQPKVDHKPLVQNVQLEDTTTELEVIESRVVE